MSWKECVSPMAWMLPNKTAEEDLWAQSFYFASYLLPQPFRSGIAIPEILGSRNLVYQ